MPQTVQKATVRKAARWFERTIPSVSGKSLQIGLQSLLKPGQRFVPRGLVGEAVPYQPDELTGELGGVADHLLSRDAANGRSGRHAQGLLALDFLLGTIGRRHVLTLDRS